ncbi:MAG: N-acetylmuramoyl-L-alanine amidase [Hellea sp.]|nr:N-acetylmuramoyl-L-alanine amidase [Hellea sp.]
MKIKSAPSPNFDDRQLPISCLVLHYTGMETGKAALDRLRDPEAKVSAHYLVEEDGKVFQLVDEENRAWHAGVSSWQGITDMNSASIGIEIVNGGHDFGLPDFPLVQIKAVIELSKAILGRHNISAQNVVGHSDIAPGRKQDPGEKFPWAELAASGVGLWPSNISNDERTLFSEGDRDRGISIAQNGLATIGYGVEVTGIMDKRTVLVVTELQRRYRPDKMDGVIDMATLGIINGLVSVLSISS